MLFFFELETENWEKIFKSSIHETELLLEKQKQKNPKI